MEAADRQTLPETSAAAAALVPFKVASFSTYAEAQQAVDFLSDQKFPVEQVSIVAEGLKFVEQVTGRLNWGKAALNGAIAGAGTGLLIGFFFGVLSLSTALVSSFVLALYGFVIGGLVGAVIGFISDALGGKNPIFGLSGRALIVPTLARELTLKTLILLGVAHEGNFQALTRHNGVGERLLGKQLALI